VYSAIHPPFEKITSQNHADTPQGGKSAFLPFCRALFAIRQGGTVKPIHGQTMAITAPMRADQRRSGAQVQKITLPFCNPIAGQTTPPQRRRRAYPVRLTG